MPDFLTKRGSFWRFCRRVPQEYLSLDTRGIVLESTKIRIADDPKGIRASQRALQMNADLEKYWRELKSGKSAETVRDYEAARRAAKAMRIAAPIDDQTKRTIEELLARIEKLSLGNRVEDRSSVLAVYDAAAKPDITFRECAAQYIDSHKAGWKNEKHSKQWMATLEDYVFPVIGDIAVKKINGNGEGTDLVLKILEPMWHTKTETASRIRGRIEQILDWAKVRGFREGENPARWRGHLKKLLPTKSKVAPTQHLNALPYADVPAFMKKLRAIAGTESKALQFTILTASRRDEAREAKWSEIDVQAKVWKVPAVRTKTHKEHHVPLAHSAIAILKSMPKVNDYVFAGTKKNQPIGENGMATTLKRLGVHVTVHGFRSSFKDWASEIGNYPNEVSEMALAHVVGNQVEAAYRRGDLLKKRQKLMADWADYCRSSSN